MMMNYATVCSGIEAPSVAWDSLGWKPQWFSEIDAFPSKVLHHHYPHVPNLGDMTKLHESATFQHSAISLLCGGTPCQSFSVAGLRKGLDDPRGNLMLTFLALADRKSPQWLVWENVPGVLSSNGGRDFGAFLGALVQLGYGFAYRVLDAQYYGVAQRRRRVFVVGHLGSWQPAAAVLFERHSLSGHPAPSRQARQDHSPVAGTLTSNGGGLSRPAGNANELDFCVPIAPTLEASFGHNLGLDNQHIDKGGGLFVSYGIDEECNVSVNHFGPLLRGGQGGTRQSVAYALQAGTTRENPDSGPQGAGISAELAYTLEARKETQIVAFGAQNSASQPLSHSEHISPTLDKSKVPGVVYDVTVFSEGQITSPVNRSNPQPDLCHTLSKSDGVPLGVLNANNPTTMAVRRLTPIECERLQGFPDGYTDIQPKGKPTPDGPRYKALGNSMAVPVMRWIGQRIELVDSILPHS
jgi:DNA (cytosine-5)-methyltransferase 1